MRLAAIPSDAATTFETGKRQTLERTTFRTSRLLDFCSQKELTAQTGHRPDAWPLVLIKELLDNALDACEDARTPPTIHVTVDAEGVTVQDDGPGIPPETVAGVLDFGVRVSSREAYVSPCRGAQGNALKTILAMPFVLDGNSGRVEVRGRGTRHDITLRVDRIRQIPVVDHKPTSDSGIRGTTVRVFWPANSAKGLSPTRSHSFYKLRTTTRS
jgi:DNA topoisomerase VI subunit B